MEAGGLTITRALYQGDGRVVLAPGIGEGDNGAMRGIHSLARFRVALLVLSAASVVVLACNAIIGTRDNVRYDATAEAGSSGSAGNPGAVPGTPGGEPGSSSGSSGDGGVCGDTTSDARNCGRCNHDCLGGACTASVCQPVVLVEAAGRPVTVVTNGNNVYVADYNGFVGRIDKTGPPGTLQILYDHTRSSSGEPDSPRALTTDSTSFYFTSQYDGVYSCPLAGCTDAGPHFFGPASSSVNGIAVAPDGRLLGAGQTEILAGSKTGILNVLFDTNYGYDMAADNAFMYFTRAGSLARADINSDAGYTDLDPLRDAFSGFVALSADRVFWTSANNSQPGHVRSLLKSGAGGITYPTPEADIRGIAVDATQVYWIAAGEAGAKNGALRVCPQTGCAASTKLISNLNIGENVFVDDYAIYVAEYGTTASDPGGSTPGRILRLAKP